MRGDGSTAHEGIFDLETGEFLRQTDAPGLAGRFVLGARTGLGALRVRHRLPHSPATSGFSTRRRCADFYIERTGDRLVPPNDWEEPSPGVPYESSAAAIAADAFWQLAGLVQDDVKARAYADYAVQILVRLASDEFLAADDPNWEGVLKHGTYHETKNLGVDESVMWGELLAARRGRHDRENRADECRDFRR